MILITHILDEVPRKAVSPRKIKRKKHGAQWCTPPLIKHGTNTTCPMMLINDFDLSHP